MRLREGGYATFPVGGLGVKILGWAQVSVGCPVAMSVETPQTNDGAAVSQGVVS